MSVKRRPDPDENVSAGKMWDVALRCTDNVYGPNQGNYAVAVANQAIYVPVVVRKRMTVVAAWYVTGGTTSGAANVDIGLYDKNRNLLTSTGSTACTVPLNTTMVTIDVADVTLDPGVYYMAIVCSSTTNRQFTGMAPASGVLGSQGILAENSALPLPATASWFVYTGNSMPLFGFLARTESM